MPIMDFSSLIPLLSLVTLLAVAVFALWSKERTEERRHDPDAPVSTLSKDGRYGGVAFLNPRLLPVRLAPALPGQDPIPPQAPPIPGPVAPPGDPVPGQPMPGQPVPGQPEPFPDRAAGRTDSAVGVPRY
jgi:hypothetical protein